MSRTTLPPNSPLAIYQDALKEQERATGAVATSFGQSLFIEPAKHGKVELQQANNDGGREAISLNATEIEWVAEQFARLLGKTLQDRVRQ
jgi:hypothetical protein